MNRCFKLILVKAFALIIFSFTGFTHAQSIDDFPTELLQLVNEARSKVQVCGSEALAPVGPLTLNQQLNQAARAHSLDMANGNFLEHSGSDGSTFDKRIEAQGYIFLFAGENVAGGKSTPQETLSQWLNSEPHCRNIMNPNFTQMGMGIAENSASLYKIYWTQLFGTPFGGQAGNSDVVISTPTSKKPDKSIETPATNSNMNAQPTVTNTATNLVTNPVQTSSEQTTTIINTQNSILTSPVGSIVNNSKDFATELLTLMNQARSQAQTCGGEVFPAVATLNLNDSLLQAAQGHSTSMAANNFFSQSSLDGKGFDKRIEAQGYRFSSVAENIIAGRPTVADVMAALLETDGYCRGLMNADFTDIGIGFGENPASQYKYYWTLTFAKPL